jgi:hypothetical protein
MHACRLRHTFPDSNIHAGADTLALRSPIIVQLAEPPGDLCISGLWESPFAEMRESVKVFEAVA